MLHFDLHHISKSKKKNTNISTFSQVVDCSGSLLSLLGDAIEYYSHDRSDNMYFNENRHYLQSMLLDLYKISPYSREMVITEEPEQINEVNEGKTVVLDNMLIKQKKTDVMRMFKNGIKREPERKLPEMIEPERKLPEMIEPERTTYNKSKNIISLDV
jgi:hypothetical protein